MAEELIRGIRTHFVPQFAHAVLFSRVSQLRTTAKQSTWFFTTDVIESLVDYRFSYPLSIDILAQHGTTPAVVVETWTLALDQTQKLSLSGHPQVYYKAASVLLRTVLMTLRQLPAHELYRQERAALDDHRPPIVKLSFEIRDSDHAAAGLRLAKSLPRLKTPFGQLLVTCSFAPLLELLVKRPRAVPAPAPVAADSIKSTPVITPQSTPPTEQILVKRSGPLGADLIEEYDPSSFPPRSDPVSFERPRAPTFDASSFSRLSITPSEATAAALQLGLKPESAGYIFGKSPPPLPLPLSTRASNALSRSPEHSDNNFESHKLTILGPSVRDREHDHLASGIARQMSPLRGAPIDPRGQQADNIGARALFSDEIDEDGLLFPPSTTESGLTPQVFGSTLVVETNGELGEFIHMCRRSQSLSMFSQPNLDLGQGQQRTFGAALEELRRFHLSDV